MADDVVSATTVIGAPARAIFAVLTDPASHAAIDGTGWVRDTQENKALTATGQIFRMPMYHPGHPNGNYEMANQIEVFDPPHAISWKPGYDVGGGTLGFGGWIWRYDLTPAGPSSTTVTLSYDWSAVPDAIRENFIREGAGFPPFPPDHLRNSLTHLAELVTA
jgi:hypothetical protein